ncbi:MAG: hypothetical protein JWO63_1135 [Frankiales bacterium]|jgi:hypothetical protein|nr:hypothetical protein [Frankiales bacterium]
MVLASMPGKHLNLSLLFGSAGLFLLAVAVVVIITVRRRP